MTRTTAPNHSKDYQRAVTGNDKCFRRTNGQFTDWFNQVPQQSFISVPFKDLHKPATSQAARGPAGFLSRK